MSGAGDLVVSSGTSLVGSVGKLVILVVSSVTNGPSVAIVVVLFVDGVSG